MFSKPIPAPPDYDGIEANMWRENASDVVPRLDARDDHLLKRIQTYIARFGYDNEAVENKMRIDRMFAATFAKEPRRMSFHENIAAEWLRKELDVEVTMLPASGANAYYVTRDGMIMQIPQGESRPSKSLDFYWEKEGKHFWAMHKYTKEGGGNQDSQFKEMRELLQNYLSASNINNVLIVIVDGPYYTTERMRQLENLTRSNPPQSYAVHIEHVPSIVNAPT